MPDPRGARDPHLNTLLRRIERAFWENPVRTVLVVSAVGTALGLAIDAAVARLRRDDGPARVPRSGAGESCMSRIRMCGAEASGGTEPNVP